MHLVIVDTTKCGQVMAAFSKQANYGQQKLKILPRKVLPQDCLNDGTILTGF